MSFVNLRFYYRFDQFKYVLVLNYQSVSCGCSGILILFMYVGQLVHYEPFDDIHIPEDSLENGIVKSIDPNDSDYVFVVYNCAGRWHDYKNYTAARTRVDQLHDGWIGNVKIKILKCDDPLMWYSDLVGETVDFVAMKSDCYTSHEPSGLVNIVHFEDAEIIRIK